MKRSEFKKLAESRLQDAKVLLESRRYAGCYYLAGYAVECALKACIAEQFKRYVVPDRNLVNDFYQHRLDTLVGVAKLQGAFKEERQADQNFEANWSVAKDWKTDSRYVTGITRQDAVAMLDSITDPDHGVLQWLRRHW